MFKSLNVERNWHFSPKYVCKFRIIETLLSTSFFKETHWEGYYLYLSTLFYWDVKKAFDFYQCIYVCAWLYVFVCMYVTVYAGICFKFVQVNFSNSIFVCFISKKVLYYLYNGTTPFIWCFFLYFCFNKFNTFVL